MGKHENTSQGGTSRYEAAGVSINRGDEAVDLMRPALEATHGPEVVSYPGGFAGLYALQGFDDPILASSIDGVGTKVLVARALGQYGSIGADIVNHCANDVLATGARPLFFLDYVASGKLEPGSVAGIVRGAAEACGALGIALIGGETAEMPGLYGAGDFDVVGTCVGACERGEAVTGERVEVGDAVIGLPSNGLHTNGYTLAREVVEDAGLSYFETPEGLDRTIGEEYLVPHRAYVSEIMALRESVDVHGMAHITGGGLPGNLPRALGGLGTRLNFAFWEEPPVFGFIRSRGGVAEEEMRRVFNLGVGFCAVVREAESGKALEVLRNVGCEAWRIGEVVEGGDVEFVS
ncbi:MAG: Phosphoribosylformylglycinamidine cyclo-ligase [uncultured Rubrobacteraceae bacterium]|uniref:Phosphoribosylformylglycinamidine cyclo-ligase n=1 Tax=uncultured Rubrobacteraceae bacterium TaxID=349277 RepID=A0A6J4Q9M7_9ACTN|nr:MAG: Phosphoribosylformylglycinamidine cyclo-ligase [uncultured Rubrobacteraceae bacterium]